VLVAIRAAFSMGVELVGNDRLTTIHKVSLIQPLPESYGGRIAAVPGVIAVTHATWFGGIYQRPQNFFPQMAVEPEDWLRMYPEYILPEDQQKDWVADRAGAVVGRATARRFGWKIGDRVPLQGTIFRRPDGGAWEFNLRGIYEAEKGVDDTLFFFQRDLVAEGIGPDRLGWVGWYVVRIDDADRAPQIAQEIDAGFANSSAETKTATEKAFMQAFANQIGDVGTIMIAILVAVFFTILLVAGNTMAQSIRERTSELAVLKTLGFSDGRVLSLVLVESCVLAGVGGLVGLGLAWALISRGDPTNGLLPTFHLPARALVLGVALAGLLGLSTGAIPAVQAMRLRIVDALRRS